MQRKFRNYLSDLTPQSLLGDISHMISLERFGHKISNRILWRVNTKDRVIALTFDDGPHPSSTHLILETLAQHDILATFFLVGSKVEANTDLAMEIVRSGHEVGNHSFSHSILSLTSMKKIRGEIEKTDKILRNLDGAKPQFFRPPVGMFSRQLLDIVEEMGYKAVIGDVYPRDPHSLNKEKIVRRVIDRTAPGSIIILHDGGNSPMEDRSQTVDSVREIIPQLKKKGFSFLTLSNLVDTSRT
jgi:peptidoglycan/xylan/chitin deacetylase (PgdA/CDA1 family)